MCTNVVEVGGIGDLPLGSVIEEVSLFLPNNRGQIVLLHAKVEELEIVEEAGEINHPRILFETDESGIKIGEEKLSGVERITYVQRS